MKTSHTQPLTNAPVITHPRKRAFLAAYIRCASITKAALRAKVDRRVHYQWTQDDPDYLRAFQAAKIEAGDALEDKLSEIAMDGNVTALIVRLKAEMPAKYIERTASTVAVSGSLDLARKLAHARELERVHDEQLGG